MCGIKFYPPLVPGGLCLGTTPGNKWTCPAKCNTRGGERGRRTGRTAKTPRPRPWSDTQVKNKQQTDLCSSGAEKVNLGDHEILHQLVKATFGELASHFNTLLFGYFPLLFPTIAVTRLSWFHSSLILTITATTSTTLDCNCYWATSHVSFMGSTTWSVRPLSNCQFLNFMLTSGLAQFA